MSDLGLFQNLINSLNLKEIKINQTLFQKRYFDELLKRLDTNYDLDD